MQENKQEKSPIKIRILQYLENKGISRYTFYKESGITRGILDQNTGISEDNISRFLLYARDISPIWLITGEGSMFTEKLPEGDFSEDTLNENTAFSKKISTFGSASGVASDVSVEYDSGNEKVIDSTNSSLLMQPSSRNEISSGKVIPYYDAEVAAGTSYGMDMNPTNPVGMIEIGGLLKDSEFAMRVYGNSMTPNYPAGCVIGLRAYNEHFIEPGTVYVVETSENRFLKRLYYNKDKSAFRCLSDNHMKYESGPMEGEYFYPEFEIPLCDIQRLHQVTGVIKRNVL